MKNLIIIVALIVALFLVAKFVAKPELPTESTENPVIETSIDLDNANIQEMPIDDTTSKPVSVDETKTTKTTETKLTTTTETNKTMDQTTQPEGKKLAMTTTASGLQYGVVTVGTGNVAKVGDTVIVHYTGTLTDGTKFDSSRDRGTPAQFPIGVGQLIKGWDEGIPGMKIGERRVFVIPGNLAYGSNPPPGSPIKANDTLVFDVELLGIK